MIDLNLIRELGGKIVGNLDPGQIKDIHNVYQEITKGSMYVVIKGSKMDGIVFVNQAIERGAIAILTATELNIDIPQIVVDNTISFIARYAAKIRQKFTKPVISIVGSAGKTTLRHTLASLLPGKKLYTRKSFNIKFAVSMTLMLLDDTYDYVIIEMGTNYPGEIDDISRVVRPDYTLISNIGVEHFEFFSNIQNIIKEEYSAAKYTQKAVISSLNNKYLLEEYSLLHLTEECPQHHFLPAFTRDNGLVSVVFNNKEIEQQITFQTTYKDQGSINALVLCLYLIDLLDLSINDAINEIKTLHHICHRYNVLKIGDLTIYDCSYNASPVSLNNLLNSIDEECIFFFGKMNQLGDISEIEHKDAIDKIYKHSLIQKAYIVGEVYIPENYRNKIEPFSQEVLEHVRGIIYVQGSFNMKMNTIIFSLLNLNFERLRDSHIEQIHR